MISNIPLEECVNLAVDYISKGNPDLRLTTTELRNLFNFATAMSWVRLLILSTEDGRWATETCIVNLNVSSFS